MSSVEAYFKFIFPTYDNLKTDTVKALCDYGDFTPNVDPVSNESSYPIGYVMTYERLPERIKSYVDQYVSMPKYFDLRNYWDAEVLQGGGQSLLVSSSPEVSSESSHANTKFKSTYDNKVVYCSLIVSSGDFFYNFNLPEEVLSRSGLRDTIVSSRFNKNFFFSKSERNAFASVARCEVGQEKRVFDKYWFRFSGYHYSYQAAVKYWVHYRDSSGNVYQHTSNLVYKDYLIRDEDGLVIGSSDQLVEYTWDNSLSQGGLTFNPDENGIFYIIDGSNEIQVTRYKYKLSEESMQNYVTDSTGNKRRVVKSGDQYIDDNGFTHSSTDVREVHAVIENRYVIDSVSGNKIEVTPLRDSSGNPIKDGSERVRYRGIGDNSSTIYEPSDYIYYLYELSPRRAPEVYSEFSEDLKGDFIDLEVTRRILYDYYDNTPIYSIPRVDSIPTIVDPDNPDKTGRNTEQSFDKPHEYIDKPPLPIDYKLLRDALNDRDPYGDCETVLVMWVADSDPLGVASGDITCLRNLHWEQYAIPISVRCCLKSGSYNDRRFLVSYPRVYNPTNSDAYIDGYLYRYHTRRGSEYDSASFKDVLYLQDLVKYSRDYVISYQYLEYNGGSDVFDIQRYLFKKCKSSFKALYARKQYDLVSYAQQHQNYYLKVKDNAYKIKTDDDSLRVCIVGKDSSKADNGIKLVPSLHFSQGDYEDYKSMDWRPWPNNRSWIINDSMFIALFDANNPAIHKVTGHISLVDADNLKTLLLNKAGTRDYRVSPSVPCDWTDIFLSSFGISALWNWSSADAIFNGIRGDRFVPLDFLHKHICINGIVYGVDNRRVVVGFKDMFDYSRNDYNHFKYKAETDTYELDEDKDIEYTAYVMDYIP